MKFMIPVPGKFPKSDYGRNYYVTDNRGNLIICGDQAAPKLLKRYDFWFDGEKANQYGLSYLHREYDNPTKNTKMTEICGFCQGVGVLMQNGVAVVAYDGHSGILLKAAGDTISDCHIFYCPMCGRKLGDD